jgi:hypothetical protein
VAEILFDSPGMYGSIHIRNAQVNDQMMFAAKRMRIIKMNKSEGQQRAFSKLK